MSDFVAAMGAWALIVLAWVGSVVVAWHGGRVDERRGDADAWAEVQAVLEAEETVVIVPQQRGGPGW